MSDRVVLIRHGETAWSSQRRHTGRTDIPLNDEGRRLAAALQPVLAAFPGIATAHVFTSPLRRARETSALAGFGERAVPLDDLLEWDYGEIEGHRTSELRETIPDWSVWTHPLAGGETVAEVAARADRVIAMTAELDGVCVLFAHAHLLRILAARWCGLGPTGGRIFTLDPASVSILGYERDARVVERWNVPAAPIGEQITDAPKAAATISRISADGSRTS